jgi:hypothetical protein
MKDPPMSMFENLELRDHAIICKFRISVHRLAIERGRYENIPKSSRVCTSCNTGQLEHEFHFFIQCPTYEKFRQQLINKIKCTYQNFNSLNGNNIFLIFDSGSLIILKAIIEFTNKCLALSS